MMNNRPYTPASADMWSFGCVLLELVTGHLKFKTTWMPCYDEAVNLEPKPFCRSLEGAIEVMLNQHLVNGTQLGVAMTSLLQVEPERRVSARALAFCFTPEEAEEEERCLRTKQQAEEEEQLMQRGPSDSGAAAEEESDEGKAREGRRARERTRGGVGGGRSLSESRGDFAGGSMSNTPASTNGLERTFEASTSMATRSSPLGGGFTRALEEGSSGSLNMDLLPPLVEGGQMWDGKDNRGTRHRVDYDDYMLEVSQGRNRPIARRTGEQTDGLSCYSAQLSCSSHSGRSVQTTTPRPDHEPHPNSTQTRPRTGGGSTTPSSTGSMQRKLSLKTQAHRKVIAAGSRRPLQPCPGP